MLDSIKEIHVMTFKHDEVHVGKLTEATALAWELFKPNTSTKYIAIDPSIVNFTPKETM